MNNGFPAEMGRFLVIVGAVMVVLGLLFIAASRFSFLGLGHLPGDIRYKGKNTSFYFPLTTCIVLSGVASLILWLISRFTRH
ncbi:MAG TPA: DUF2905 domain-containing protein [Terriglobia bacterium]|nr:DUF2905 domain-containing protein [Terriglobia bacterium]